MKKIFVCATYEVIQKSTEVPKGDGVLDGCDGTVAGKLECRDTQEKTDRLGCRRYDMY